MNFPSLHVNYCRTIYLGEYDKVIFQQYSGIFGFNQTANLSNISIFTVN